VLEGIDRIRRHAALENQLGRNEPIESGLQLYLWKTRDGVEQLVVKLASYRRADLRYPPH